MEKTNTWWKNKQNHNVLLPGGFISMCSCLFVLLSRGLWIKCHEMISEELLIAQRVTLGITDLIRLMKIVAWGICNFCFAFTWSVHVQTRTEVKMPLALHPFILIRSHWCQISIAMAVLKYQCPTGHNNKKPMRDRLAVLSPVHNGVTWEILLRLTRWVSPKMARL